jgi:transposase InsO family protein
MKKSLTVAPALAYFEQDKELIISADSSSYALGGVLLQRHDNVLRPIAYCSRSLTKSERNYAQIEKELLASVFACEKFRMYVQGIEFNLQSDHKPLIPLINKKNLVDAPVRCQRLLMRLARYTPTAEYVPGKYMVVADTLSRDVMPCGDVNDELSREVQEFAVHSIRSLPVSETRMEAIVREQNRDDVISRVKTFTIEGWPSKAENDLSEYYEARGYLSIVNDILIFRDRIVIPKDMRVDILNRIHNDGHLSLNKCRRRAQDSVWWPYISKELTEFIEKCDFCQVHKRNNRSEPLKPTTLPDRPWQRIALDLFELNGDRYLIVVDYFSRWFEVIKMTRIDSESVISVLKRIFVIFGIPEIVQSDRGLQFNSLMFRSFAIDYDFSLTYSDPFYPQGNGCAERAVQVAKRLYKQPDPLVALMAYRTTPLDTTGCSPSQLIMGRNIRSKLPTLPRNLAPCWPDMSVVRNNDDRAKQRSAESFNKRMGARKLPELSEGQQVRIRLPLQKQWSQPESVLLRRGETSYAVRNRRHLQPLPEPQSTKEVREDSESELESGPVSSGESSDGHASVSPSPPVLPAPVHSNVAPLPYRTRCGRQSKPVVKYQAS